ncbi:amino acid adenylation domain-containing protein [Nostoc sp. ChiQUE01b]|uniref:non-ribosomal peptide synthetase n=1 Tax=Nostoc sp. ChiQUE01b TaxID=3075376 RepID=UPI002AD2D0D9|nr:amino acid adenylation domain-containing protein [Nostoc sp. ChiQUE01b]MDZ8262380.1 amino acid adenylation domain-containing protein [Nostoc sp. ChiQUE01b]
MIQNNIEDIYELSPMQQGMLFHKIAAPNSVVYFEQACFSLQTQLNVLAFQKAWQRIVDRHTILRTSFYWDNLDKPYQVVHQQVDLPWEFQDWRQLSLQEQQKQLKAFLKADGDRGFELSQAPLIRLTLIQVADNTYEFVFSFHHILMEGWSINWLWKEFYEFYNAFCQGQDLYLEAPRPYREYIAWLQQQDLNQAEAFWRQKLKGFTLPTPIIVGKSSASFSDQKENYQRQEVSVSATMTTALKSFARKHQITLNILIKGAWALLLNRYNQESDIVFGSTSSGRPTALADAESMIGLFINTLPLRVQVQSNAYLSPWLKKLQAEEVQMREYEYSPLLKIQQWSEIPRGLQLFDSILIFDNELVDYNQGMLAQSIGVVESQLLDQSRSLFDWTNYPLTVKVVPKLDLLNLCISYDTRRFDSATITRMLGHFQTLLSSIVSNPEQRISDLQLLTPSEVKQLLVEWNDTKTDYAQDKCIHQLFEAQVEKTPNAIAVVFEDQQLSYRELNAKANQLAHYLQKLGVKPEVLVGICVERSLYMVVGLLGILKAGGAYIPLDPAYPKERLAFILEDAQVPLLLTQASLLSAMPQHKAQVICLDTDWQANTYGTASLLYERLHQRDAPRTPNAQQSKENLLCQLTTENLAYIIYTSGSTGQPKGVQIPHSALSNFLFAMKQTPGLTQEDTLLAITTNSFDIAVLELFLPIIVGGRLVVVSREVALDVTQLSATLADSKATVMQATPATWQLLLVTGWGGNDQLKILCGGEALPAHLANQLRQRCHSLWNMYGPTETTIWSAASQIKTDSKVVPISHPIANTQLYILDQYSQLVPVGIAGELHIGGQGLARGYFNRPELTAQKFIPNPFSNNSAARLYKTGDLARYLPNGDIEYLGRIDYQVKIRGFRIELGEIEAIISQYPVVRETVVVAADAQSLVAYVVPHTEQTLMITELRGFLESNLPNYMLPTAFVILEALPLTPNGKVDRKALKARDTARPQLQAVYQPPQTEVEKTIADIWQEILQVENVGIHDNFFELGGHSLLLVKVYSKLQKTFQRDFSMIEMFQYPTISYLAKYLIQESSEQAGFTQHSHRHESRSASVQQRKQARKKHRAATKQKGVSLQ